MPEALTLFLVLLAPVALLLFLNQRFSRRLRYPHELLADEERRGPASFLRRSFRAYYDLLFDALIALTVALAAAGSLGGAAEPGRGRSAVVVDCGRSMLAGRPGSRPIDLAAKRLSADPELAGAEPFALAFDPARAATRLVPLRRLLGGLEGEAAARRLEAELAFFAVDYRELAELGRRGFAHITLLTDSPPFRAEGFEAVELAPAAQAAQGGSFAAYPAAARYDRASGSHLVAFAESGPRADIAVEAWNAKTRRFERLDAAAYRVEERESGHAFRLAAPGLYLFRFRGPYGEAGADFAIRLAPPALQAAAAGPFSERMLKVFPLFEPSRRPELVLADEGTGPEAIVPAPAAGAAARARRLLTRAAAPEGLLIVDPALTHSRPLASGPLDAGLDFSLDSAAAANEDLPLAYDGAVLAGSEPPFLTAPPPGAKDLVPAGSAFLVPAPRGAAGADALPRALNAPPEEYFPAPPRGRLRLPPPPDRRLPWTAILGLLFAGKLFAWKKSSGKSLFGRDPAREPSADAARAPARRAGAP